MLKRKRGRRANKVQKSTTDQEDRDKMERKKQEEKRDKEEFKGGRGRIKERKKRGVEGKRAIVLDGRGRKGVDKELVKVEWKKG